MLNISMKTSLVVMFAFAWSVAVAQPGVSFDRYFIDSTLRVDLYHVGEKNGEFYSFDRMLREGIWAGTTEHLVDPFNLGRYRVRLFDIASNALVYSRGYDCYFGEYRTTDPAKNGVKRVYQETIRTPYPRKPVLMVIDRRDRYNVYEPLFEQCIDPSDYHIITESPDRGDKVITVQHAGDPHRCVDLVFVSEGYTAAEEKKFESDVKRFSDSLFAWQPYQAQKGKFNISAVFASSPQSGVDEPRQGIYRKTLLDATFNSLDSDRYLLTEENKTMRDVAGQVPYDAVLVMVNSKRYGGGGIYNDFTAFTSDGPSCDFVFVHEFGHAFAGLGDEYMGDVSYEDFYPKGVEPTEPNLTALLDPTNLKWKDLVSPGVSIPTDWGQAAYDSLVARRGALMEERGKRQAEMQQEGKSEGEIKEMNNSYSGEIGALNKKIGTFLVDNPMKGKVGAFEGGGYTPKGIFRPTVNSLMNQFSKTDHSMYPVNERAVRQMIDYFAGQ